MCVWWCSAGSSSLRIPFRLGFHLKQRFSILPPGEHFAVSSEEGPLGGTEPETGAGPGEESLQRGHSQHPHLGTGHTFVRSGRLIPSLSDDVTLDQLVPVLIARELMNLQSLVIMVLIS